MKKLCITIATVALSLTFCPAMAAPPQGADNGNSSSDPLSNLISNISPKVQEAGNVIVERTNNIVGVALGFLGTPYRFGGNTENGFDCSGFVRYVYQNTLGLVLPRRAAEQAAQTRHIDRSELAPGDLVFFNTRRSPYSHVGIYMGDNQFIHSPRTGRTVSIDSLNNSYWSRAFNGARRVDRSHTGNAAQNKKSPPLTPEEILSGKITEASY